MDSGQTGLSRNVTSNTRHKSKLRLLFFLIKKKKFGYREAEATRNALHGVQWPIGNGKKLIIDFATAEDMENAKNPPAPPPPAPVPDVKVSAKENLVNIFFVCDFPSLNFFC